MASPSQFTPFTPEWYEAVAAQAKAGGATEQALADLREEERRRRRDEEYVRQVYGLEPDVDPATRQVVGRLPDPATIGTTSRITQGADRAGDRGYWVSYTDQAGKEQTKFQSEKVGGVTLTPRQAAVYAMGDGRTGQSITITTPDGHSVNFATGLDALPNYFDEKAGKYVPMSAGQYARAHQAELANDPAAWNEAMNKVKAAYGAPTPDQRGAGAAPPGSPGPASGPGGGPAGGGTSGAGGPPTRSSQASGQASGVSWGDDLDYRPQMTNVLHSLGVVNADRYITDALVDQFALAKASPNAIATYYRSTPSSDVSGITLGQEIDFRRASQQALARFGIQREPTADEIRRTAQAGLDAEGVAQMLAGSPDVLAANPGARYDLTRQQYRQERGEIERFAAGSTGQAETGATDAGSEPDYLREAFSERMAPAEVETGIADVQRRLGRPVTAEDVKRIRTRPTVKTEEDRAGPRQGRSAAGPTTDIGAPERNYVGPRRG